KSADPLSEKEISHIFNHPALSCDIPEGLFRRVFLWIGCCSARCGGTYQEIMNDHFKKHDDGGFDLVIIHDKTHQGGLYHRSHSDESIGSCHAFNDISNITLPFKRLNNYDEIEGHKFKFIKCHNITVNIHK